MTLCNKLYNVQSSNKCIKCQWTFSITICTIKYYRLVHVKKQGVILNSRYFFTSFTLLLFHHHCGPIHDHEASLFYKIYVTKEVKKREKRGIKDRDLSLILPRGSFCGSLLSFFTSMLLYFLFFFFFFLSLVFVLFIYSSQYTCSNKILEFFVISIFYYER